MGIDELDRKAILDWIGTHLLDEERNPGFTTLFLKGACPLDIENPSQDFRCRHTIEFWIFSFSFEEEF
jgi:hypothetical protein